MKTEAQLFDQYMRVRLEKTKLTLTRAPRETWGTNFMRLPIEFKPPICLPPPDPSRNPTNTAPNPHRVPNILQTDVLILRMRVVVVVRERQDDDRCGKPTAESLPRQAAAHRRRLDEVRYYAAHEAGESSSHR